MRAIAIFLIASLSGCATAHEDAPGGLASPTDEARPAATVAFTEGPTVDREGTVYFSEMVTSRILKYTPPALATDPAGRSRNPSRRLLSVLGGIETFRTESGGANGLIFDRQGRLIAAEGEARRVTRTDLATDAIEVLAENHPGSPLDLPNDLTLDGRGRIYFTDYLGRRVYRIDPDGSVEQILGPDDVEAPNGIVISPDDRTLYHVEASQREGGARNIRAYDLAEDGTVDNMRVFHDFHPGRSADGLAIDREGNVYAAAGLNRTRGSSETLDTKAGIHVFAPDGRKIGFHPIWEDTVTNCAFGGEDMKTLYVTAGKTLFAIRTEIAGTPR
ncbi:MAG: SMP-30/gluconolactonase/LRE family protein [Deltaproteobacteria bacterium]|nr:SMP-30/gluconolactonase/LRE family protein [Deltaproteobacteria bacterium]MBW2499952.1 SMP-30/gluconolactonase/LRE family protein [Deltaproteobacteria bacterium]